MSTSTWSNLLITWPGARPGAQPGSGSHAQDPDLLERRLDHVIHAARRTWPTVELATDRYVTHLARHLPEGVAVEHALDQMHTDDLYLACACALGNRQAVLAFEQHCMDGLEIV